MTDVEDVPGEVLDDVAFLARSENRVKVLEALTDGSHSTRELRDLTGTSKTTLHRIVTEFEERSWTRRTVDGDYEATPRAEHVAVQFRPFLDSMATVRDLGEDATLLPADELAMGPDGGLTLGLHHFADAVVDRKRPQEHGVGRDEFVAALRETSTIHAVSNGSPPRVVGEAMQARADGGDISGAFVLTAELLGYLRDDHEGPPRWEDMIEAGVDMYRYDDSVPVTLVVADESTFVWDESDETPQGVVISRNEAVRQWGLDVVDRYRERSVPIDPAAFR